jgi:NitT/TauT family transport system permease protein
MKGTEQTERRALGVPLSVVVLVALTALLLEFRAHALIWARPRLSVQVQLLPHYALLSFYRMLAAYLLALLFGLAYGLAAARSRAWERVLLPAIDVAQSVPVVGFFPAAVYFFVSLTNGKRPGVELAAIFLIFTSQAWNLALGVFEAVKTIPTDLQQSAETFGVAGLLKLRRLVIPACIPKLVYNSILSWVSGWYFLIACEIISVGPAQYRLPGLGSYLMEAVDKGRPTDMVAGLLALVAVVVLLHWLVWQPLALWAEKFRFEFTALDEAGARPSAPLTLVGGAGAVIYRAAGAVLRPMGRSARKALGALPRPGRGTLKALALAWRAARTLAGFLLAALALGVTVKGMVALGRILLGPWPAEAGMIPLATLASLGRIVAAYLLTLAWTVPCALWASQSTPLARRLAAAAQVVGAIPATALFPLIVLLVIRLTGGMNLAAVLLILTGMQWYVLFNLLAGVSQLPDDLKEAARAFGLSRWRSWRQVVLPSLVPSLVTGSMTAWGGGWNALILSEYFVYHGKTYEIAGLGSLLDEATYRSNDSLLFVLSLLTMVVTVIVLNRLVWRRLYALAAARFTLDY